MKDSAVRWSDPPDTTGPKSTLWQDLLEPLRERPGAWRFVRTMKLGSANVARARINSGESISVEPGQYEATVRKRGDLGDIWARYIGNGCADSIDGQ